MVEAEQPIIREIGEPSAIGPLVDRMRSVSRPSDIAYVVDGLARTASLWRANDWRDRAAQIPGLFGLAGVGPTLDALLDSMDAGSLRDLVASEGIGPNDRGYAVIGHAIASNTPLLAWTSIVRALLVGSASVVKLPSHAASAVWAELFLHSLSEAAPNLAARVALAHWKGGQADIDDAFCSACDLILAYGSDETIGSLRSMRGGQPFIGYGHRVSIAVVERPADVEAVAEGLAVDILLYDQRGCLSPHMVYVRGGQDECAAMAAALATALARRSQETPTPPNDEARSMMVIEARSLARMEGLRVREAPDQRWTVIERCSSEFSVSPTHAVVSIAPYADIDELNRSLAQLNGMLQGCAVLKPSSPLTSVLKSGGITYVCEPGKLQCPPLSWPEDGVAPLRSLLAD